MNTLALLNGLRFVDSFFPSGGYAYSSGLEAAVQAGAVKDGDGLSRYVEDLLRGGIGRREAVAVGLAHGALVSNALETALETDSELDAMKVCRETRLASRQMGRQVLRVASEQMRDCTLLQQFDEELEAGRTPGHLPVGMGLTLGACGWPCRESIAVYLYQVAVGLVSAAMKLLPVGQRESQQLLQEWTPVIMTISRQAAATEQLSSWAPLQDIYAMRHSRLESRLFRS